LKKSKNAYVFFMNKVGIIALNCPEIQSLIHVKRFQKEISSGIIDKYTIHINCKRLGFEGEAFLLLKVKGDIEDTIDQLMNIPEIRCIYRITGTFDLLVCASCMDMESLTQLIDKVSNLPNIVDSENIVILDIIQEKPYPDPEVIRKAMLRALKAKSR